MLQALKLERERAILWVTLNRPDSLNALNGTMVRELRDCFSALRTDLATRVVILRGAGRAFCAGADLKEAHGARGGQAISLEAIFEAQRNISGLFVLMRRAPQPIIACVQGAACGGGFALALASDIRIGGRSARMNVAPVRIGLSGCDVGLSYFLPRMVGASMAAELLLTGNFVDAARAERSGLFSRVVADAELESAARQLAGDILRNAPFGVQLTKDCLNSNLDAGSLEQAIAMEDRNQVLCANSRDFREGVEAFVQKRPAVYAPR